MVLRKPVATRGSLRDLLDMRGQLSLFLSMLLLGAVLGWLFVRWYGVPLWGAMVLGLLLLLVPAVEKWRADWNVLGWPLTLLSILLATQSFHTIEHLAQWAQYHLLGWPLKASGGLISPLNAEIVHFAWNWGVLLAVGVLLAMGLRNGWMWGLVAWAMAHTAEHTYLFVNYLLSGGKQGLPGFFGVGGWLARQAATSQPVDFFCRIVPGLVEAPRLDVHFWWNIGEIMLLLLAARAVVRDR